MILSLITIALIFLAVAYFSVQRGYRSLIYDSVEAIPEKPVAVVLGAGVWGETLSPVLEDRVFTGVELYKEGKVKKLLMTGDNSEVDYDDLLP